MTTTTKYHDTEIEGSIHIPNNFVYADQPTRKAVSGLSASHIGKIAKQSDDGSFWFLSAVSPTTWEVLTPPFPAVGDIGKIPKVQSDGAGDIKIVWSADTSTTTLNDAYVNESGAANIPIDNGDVTWSPTGTYSLNVDVSACTGLLDGFQVLNGTDYVKYLRKGANNIQVEMEVEDFDIVSNGSFTFTSPKSASLTVTAAGEDLTLGGRATTITLNESGDTSLSGFTAISLVGGMNELKTATDGFTVGAVLFGGSSGEIDEDKPNLFWDDSNNVLGIGTTDTDGTPATGTATVKGTTNDGSTNIQVWRDSDEANVATLDSNGLLTISASLTAAGVFTTSTSTFTASTIYRDLVDVVLGTGVDARMRYSTTQTNAAVMLALSTDSNTFLICEEADKGVDFANSVKTDPTTIHQAADVTDLTKQSLLSWNNFSIGGSKGSFLNAKSITEELTIPSGQGAAGVATSGNLAPANSNLKGVTARVTQAPGAGATIFDIGITGSGNQDELMDGVSTAIDTTGTSPADNDGTQLPLLNGSATTLTVTTDVNVTVVDMKLRIVTYYEEFIPPTS